MIRAILWSFSCCILMSGSACRPDPGDRAPATDDTLPVDDTETEETESEDSDSDSDSDTETDAPQEGLSGIVIDAAGQPIGRMPVLACTSAFCLFYDTDTSGRFVFEFEVPELIALKTHEELDHSPRRAAALVPCVLDLSPDFDVGTLYVPNLPAGLPLGPDSDVPQTFAVAEGLELTLRTADLTPTFGERLSDIAASPIPPAHIPRYTALAGEEVLAVYAMHPFAATSSSPIGVRARLDIADDTPVKFRTISELDGTFSEAVPGRADDGQVTTDPSLGITQLTYLVISR